MEKTSLQFPALRQRLVVGASLGAFFAFVLMAASLWPWGRTLLLLFGCLVCVLATFEYAAMGFGWHSSEPDPHLESNRLGVLVATGGLLLPMALFVILRWWLAELPDMVTPGAFLTPASQGLLLLGAGGVGLGLPVAAALLLWRDDLEALSKFLQRWGLGLGVVVLPSLCFLMVSVLPQGPKTIFWLTVVVVASDTAAYFGGNMFGGAKLAPALSPGKTVSGAVCGLTGAVCIGTFLGMLFGANSLLLAVVVSLLVGILAQGGDLFESAVKRICGVKDSGALLPGHGGILDRIDGLLFAMPVGFLVELLLWFQ